MLQRKPASMETKDMDGMWLPGLAEAARPGWPQPGSSGHSWSAISRSGQESCHGPFLCPALPCLFRDMWMKLRRSSHAVICDGSAGECKGLSGILNFLVERYWQFPGKVSSLLPFYEFVSLAQALFTGWGWRYLMESGHLTLGLGSLAATTNHQRKRNRDTKSYWYFPGLIKTGIES